MLNETLGATYHYNRNKAPNCRVISTSISPLHGEVCSVCLPPSLTDGAVLKVERLPVLHVESLQIMHLGIKVRPIAERMRRPQGLDVRSTGSSSFSIPERDGIFPKLQGLNEAGIANNGDAGCEEDADTLSRGDCRFGHGGDSMSDSG